MMRAVYPALPGQTTHWDVGSGYGPFAVGLDLGQATDFSALAVVEHVNVLPPDVTREEFESAVVAESSRAARAGVFAHVGGALPPAVREFHVRHVQRWPLGTPYHRIVDDVCEVVSRGQLRCPRLTFDRSGVGRAVGDLLRQAHEEGRMLCQYPVGVTITGEGTYSKRNLLAALQMPLQQGRLRIARDLPLGDVLERELTSFKLKLTQSGHDAYDVARREGEGHGDLVIALALAVFQETFGVRPSPLFAADVPRFPGLPAPVSTDPNRKDDER